MRGGTSTEKESTSDYRSHDFIDVLLSHFSEDEGANRAVKCGVTAAIKESLRLGPPTPLLALRESIEDCQVGGFCVPAGTKLLVNLWKIHHDLRVWADPDQFQPERFLGSNVNVQGLDFQLLPFGSGRRMCPAISFALRVVHIALARLLQGFDMKLLAADSSFDDDNPLGFGTTLNVLLAPRLPQAFYG
ncbi:xanthotoxin 5-hydroxylase CYP82C2-like isoform X2 [Nymphaea colorata]|nr:xanthotoxin 5-hydroxylase CYP82C2-like isoform X2 [Nymphaea colorata]